MNFSRQATSEGRNHLSVLALFFEKHDKTLRLCVDYRRLNAITVKDAYPTPRVDVSIDKMKGARFFAKMDLRSGFYQISVAPENVQKQPSRPSGALSSGW